MDYDISLFIPDCSIVHGEKVKYSLYGFTLKALTI